FVLRLIKEVGKPLLVPSANPSGLKPAKDYLEVINYFDNKIDATIKGDIKSNMPSTIIKIDGDNIILIRQGEITLKEIMEAI
ncbi:MAG: Sua5/YciO/YrdC/YwlC family protein, partial [Mollicutes bacterium]|nr:Sua5/YciO/YrdC/YwlC family protein [Mollicutes bacterium]